MAGIGITVGRNEVEEDETPVVYTEKEQALLVRLIAVRPNLAEHIDKPAMAEDVRRVFGASLLPSLVDRGFDLDKLDNDAFELFLFAFRPTAVEGVISDEDMARILAWDAEKSADFLTTWVSWSREEAYGLFKVDYQIKHLSRHTEDRWANFQDEWAKVTRDARAKIFAEYLEGAEDSDLSFEWQLSFLTPDWVRAVEVEWVPSDRAAGSDADKAVPTGASGKALDL